jgi:hypothetical protein
VAEHGILEIQLIEAAAHEQPKQPARESVPDGREHLGSLMSGPPACERPGQTGRLTFFTPQAVWALPAHDAEAGRTDGDPHNQGGRGASRLVGGRQREAGQARLLSRLFERAVPSRRLSGGREGQRSRLEAASGFRWRGA